MRYSVQKNNFKKDMYYGAVLSKGSSDLIEVLLKYKDRIPEETMSQMINDLENSLCRMLSEGYSVNLGGLLTINPVIKGTFDGPEDQFDPGRHKIDVSVEVGDMVREYVRNQQIKLKKVDSIRRVI